MKRKHIDFFIYISLIFLIYALIKNRYLSLPSIKNWPALCLSVLFLLGFYLSSSFNWQMMLRKHEIFISPTTSLSSFGLSVFGKYIPGKIWTVMGQAVYVSEGTHVPLKDLSAISLENLLFHIWTGLIFGGVGVFIVGGMRLWGWIILLFLFILTLVLWSSVFHIFLEKTIRLIQRREIKIPRLESRLKMSLIPWFSLNMLLLTLAFYLFSVAICSGRISLPVGLGFPLAGTLGLMAFFAPGGLGIREGILIGYLKLAGISTQEAVTISVSSRLWVLMGESLIFILGYYLDKRRRG